MSLSKVEGLEELWETSQYELRDFSLDKLAGYVDEARKNGCNAWGTVTDKDREPWRVKIYFWKRIER